LPTFLNVYTAWQREAVYVPPARGGAQAQRRLIQQKEAKGNGNGNNNKLLPHGVWCQQNFISGRSLSRAYNVRQQLQNLCARSTAQNGLGMNVLASCGGSTNDRLPFLKCLAAGLFMQAASRIVTDRDENGASKGRSGLLVSHRGRYRTKLGNNTVSVHPASMMFNRQPAPKCVVYTELVVTKKTYIRGVTQIREEWLQEAEPKFYNA
jgi:pre-mRNA-splicing factor ATP-dependent RNA helicase DHX16